MFFYTLIIINLHVITIINTIQYGNYNYIICLALNAFSLG